MIKANLVTFLIGVMILSGCHKNTVTNKVPVAHAGSPVTITLPTNLVTLNGTGTDADGHITAY